MATARPQDAICRIVEDRILELETKAGREPNYDGVVMIDGMLLVVDYMAKNLQVYNGHDGKLITSHELEYHPTDVCLIRKNEVAVGLGNGTVVILSLKSIDDVKLFKTLETGFDECLSLAKLNSDKLVVSGWKHSMLCWGILSIKDGRIDSTHDICKGYITRMAVKDNTVYISCYTSDIIAQGVYAYDIFNPHTQKFLYRHQELKFPWSIMADWDCVYVCDRNSNRIHQLTDSGQLVTIYTVSSRLDRIFFDDQLGLLYTTSMGSSAITVYKMGSFHQPGNPLEAVRPVDVLLAIISDKSIETILQMTTSLQESEILDIEIINVSTHLQHIHEESLTQSERRKEDIFKTLFDSCKSDLLSTLKTGEHSDDILRSALEYILPINDPSATAAILNVAGANLKSKLSNPDCDVWGGLDVRIDSKCRVSLVCLHRGILNTQPDSHLGLPVLYREYYRIEREPFEASFSDEYHTSISPENLRRANILINKHGEELFKRHTNLVAVSPSSVLSKSRGLKIEPSIVLYCRMKGVIPIGENHFPKTLELEGIILSTDIREGFFTFAMHEQAQQKSFTPIQRNDKLRMGCSIGGETSKYSGTLGPFVRLGSDGVGFITCAHVIEFKERTKIVHPGNGDSYETERACGTVLDVQFNPDKPVDAALIKVNNRDVAPTDFTWFNPKEVDDAGFDATKPPSFLGGSVRMDMDLPDFLDKRVIKSGKKTGLTQGSLVLNGTMIKIEDCDLPFSDEITRNGKSSVLMKNQYQVENYRYPFCSDGDSGAGVFLVENEQNNLSLIGILIGFLNHNTVVTPIGPVLESLKLNQEDVIADDRYKVTTEIHKSSCSYCTLQ